MRAASLSAGLLLTVAVTAGHAQERVHRCGAAYSHEACAGGVTMTIDDTRSAGQVAQARQVALLDARLAERLARDREQAERAAARQGPTVIGGATRTAPELPERRGRPDKRAKAERITLYRSQGAPQGAR